MKAKDIQIGKVYAAKVSGKIVSVHVYAATTISHYPRARSGFRATNLTTGRDLVIGAARLRYECFSDGRPVPVGRQVGTVGGVPVRVFSDAEIGMVRREDIENPQIAMYADDD